MTGRDTRNKYSLADPLITLIHDVTPDDGTSAAETYLLLTVLLLLVLIFNSNYILHTLYKMVTRH